MLHEEPTVYLEYPPPLALTIFLPLLPHSSLYLEMRRLDKNIPLKTEYSEFSHSVLWRLVGLYVNYHQLQGEAFLMWVDAGTNIWV